MMDAMPFIDGLSILHLRFTVRAKDAIAFGSQPGSAIRGALYQALSQHFCSEPGHTMTADHTERCPVCWLLAAEDPQRERGRWLPRPLTIQPPRDTRFQPGDIWTFGLTCVGDAQDMTLYLLRAVQKMGEIGIGRGRGRFELRQISEVNPLLDAERTLLNGHTVQKPRLHVTANTIRDALAYYPESYLLFDFLTPCRLIADGRLVKKPVPAVLIQRLIERIQALMRYYTPADRQDWRTLSHEAVAHAKTLTLHLDETRWQEHSGNSRRQNRRLPLSGFTGRARWDGEIQPLLPLLLTGQSVQVGKNTVKGNGWYRVTR